MDPSRVVTLTGLAEGAAEEFFQDAWRRVLDNIEDPNTDPEKTREIILKIQVTPDEERKTADVVIIPTVKLAGVKGVTTFVYLGKHHGRLGAAEGERQRDIFTEPEGGPRPVAKTSEGGA